MPSIVKHIAYSHTNFPTLLKEIPGAPNELYYLGELPQPGSKIIAIVGTRKATHEGLTVAKNISSNLARAGVIIVSGLALGIDGAAHSGALEANGKTIAVLGNGVDNIYPKQHANLAKHIIDRGGAIISEYPAGTPSLPHQFLERNRIVSGLSMGVVIIEAPLQSGSLVTAKHALDQGREVFVVPGLARHPNYRGSHMLLRQGARLVTTAEEIMEDLEINPINEYSVKFTKTTVTDEVTQQIMSLINKTTKPLSVDTIAEITTLEPHIIQKRLTFLLFENIVEEIHGTFKLKRPLL
ncbi:DNA-protecting protein DprA [Candidatus Jorgensenbacteria bacterium]|nr:DNA-protecting protein DprA [Candidatus Jorgensenbacteria bacterium]